MLSGGSYNSWIKIMDNLINLSFYTTIHLWIMMIIYYDLNQTWCNDVLITKVQQYITTSKIQRDANIII